MGQKTYSDIRPDGLIDVWEVERLWEIARRMPVERVPLSQITDFDLVTWFGGPHRPTCRAVAEHARRIQEVTFKYPVILSAAGHVMDGMHRVAKAWLLGLEEVEAVRFDRDPEPDARVSPPEIISEAAAR